MPNNHPILNEEMLSKAGPGRPKGSLNVATKELREYIKLIVSNQLPQMEEALEEVKKRDPYKYLSLVQRFVDMVLPKQQQVDITNESAIDIDATIKYIKDKLNVKE